MNLDEFEKQLQQQPLRHIPAEWRDEILDAARRVAGAQPSTLNPQPFLWWRELLWPCPQAWVGLAAVWAVILVLNVASHETIEVAGRRAAPLSRELIMALQEQRRLFSELIEPAPPVEPARTFVPRPRSELPPRSFPV
jgi:hypothetical protein